MTLPADLPARLNKAGLRVNTVPGWRTRGRPGSFAPRGVLWHHTGGAGDGLEYARWMALTGRPDLPAPLCQLSIGRDGTVYVLAAGRANHGGTARAAGPMPSGDANTLYVGVECHNTGSEGWRTEQRDAMVKVGVVLSEILGCTAEHNRGHVETSVTGKWDPGALDLDEFRADLAAVLNKPKALPKRVVRYLSETLAIRKELTREIQRLKAAREVAKRKGEMTGRYTRAIRQTREARKTLRVAREAARRVPKR